MPHAPETVAHSPVDSLSTSFAKFPAANGVGKSVAEGRSVEFGVQGADRVDPAASNGGVTT